MIWKIHVDKVKNWGNISLNDKQMDEIAVDNI